jgi:multidrug resistance efflux pump
MYEADELVDDTEEIVLKRQRRALAMMLEQVELSRAQRMYSDEVSEPMQVESRKEDVAMQEAALVRLLRSQEIDAAARADAEARSTAELAEKRERLERMRADAALFTLVAPSAGVVLHGEADDYRPGATAKRLERGSRLSARSDVMLVADPARMAVAVGVPESKVGQVVSGTRAAVRPLARPEPALEGTLELEAWPEPKGGDEGVFAGTVRLRGKAPEGLVFGMHAKVELALEPPPEG